MKSHILATEAFNYTAEIRKLDRPDCGYQFGISSTWLDAKDPNAKRTVFKTCVDHAGLLALRVLIEASTMGKPS